MSYGTLGIFLLTITAVSTAWELCSETKEPASCVPCIGNDTDTYKCPGQCGDGLDLCDQVCNDHCVRSECEYDNGSLICLHGCTEPHTGPYCQQQCQEGCTRCAQDGGRCLECQTGRYGKACDQTCSNCRDELCHGNGTCTAGCKPGFYGRQCDNTCSKCEPCDKEAPECDMCDDFNGTCLLGCTAGYYGAKCDRKCHSRCTQCEVQTGECQQCTAGWFGRWCKKECEHCTNKRCSYEDGQCTEGCEKGFQQHGNMCKKLMSEPPKEPHEKKPMSDLANIFGDEDYLLPVIGCLLVLCAVIAVVIIWRCRKLKDTEKTDVEDGTICNGVSSHPSLRRASTDSAASSSPYKDIVEEAIRTHSCEEILKKHNLLDPDKPRLSPPVDKSLATLRNRPGNFSMPFMTPIEEDEEEEMEDDGVHMPNVGIIFTLESPSEEDGCEDALSSLTASPGKDSNLTDNGIPQIVVSDDTGSSVDHPEDLKDIYILQRGQHNIVAGRAISSDCLDTSHSSGMSTPRVPDMYLHNLHGGENEFSTMLSDHLDTFLTDRSTDEAEASGVALDASESDALLGSEALKSNNTQNVSKSGIQVPKKLKPKSGDVVVNGNAGIEMDHISFSSEKKPMLCNTYESSA